MFQCSFNVLTSKETFKTLIWSVCANVRVCRRACVRVCVCVQDRYALHYGNKITPKGWQYQKSLILWGNVLVLMRKKNTLNVH